MEDVLDTEESDLLELGTNHLFEQINSRIRREIESMREKKKRERAQIRADIKVSIITTYYGVNHKLSQEFDWSYF